MENSGHIRKALGYQRGVSETSSQKDEYPLDRHDAENYFWLQKEWKQEIVEYFNTLHSQGKDVVYVDICGRASAKNLGADRSYGFSLKTPEARREQSEAGDTFIDGDIFDSKAFASFLAFLKEKGDQPNFVTFEPAAGLKDYNPLNVPTEEGEKYKEVVYQQLEKRLVDMIEILKPGGYVYLSRPFQKIENFVFDEIKRIVTDSGCEIEMSNTAAGPQFLIRKPLDEIKK
jgi:hypothetical protein